MNGAGRLATRTVNLQTDVIFQNGAKFTVARQNRRLDRLSLTQSATAALVNPSAHKARLVSTDGSMTVDAVVLPDEALSENLLGLSFLSKLKRFEYANGRLVLEQ